MAPEDILLLGVALLIGTNRGFTGTGLTASRAAFAVVQLVNILACVGLLFFRLEGFPSHLDGAVRLFLTGVVTWHMVLNHQARQTHLHAILAEVRRGSRKDAISGLVGHTVTGEAAEGISPSVSGSVDED